MIVEEYKPVYLEWIDVIADPEGGWKAVSDTEEFFDREDNVSRELGFVFSEDDDFLCIVSRYMPSPDVTITGNRTKIPKKWILRRVNLKVSQGKAEKLGE